MRTDHYPRIPFLDAVSDPLLLGNAWKKLSLPQQTALLTFYGCPLTEEQQRIFSMFQEAAEYDSLGFLRSVEMVPYERFDYNESAWIIGRRGGKTLTAAFFLCYEATLGGHEAYLAPNQQGICYLISQDLRTSTVNLRSFVISIMESSPILSRMIAVEKAEQIDLKPSEPGAPWFSIMCVPPKAKNVRGFSCPAAVMDEIASWSTDPDAADPDHVVYNTLTKAQLTFPHRKRMIISSAGDKRGLLWELYKAGTRGWKLPEELQRPYRRTLVLTTTTAGMQSPLITHEVMEEEATKPDFETECLSIFRDTSSGAFTPAMVSAAIDRDVWERPPSPLFFYSAAMDPAFRNDSFSFTIFHQTSDGKLVQDVLMEWIPEKGNPLKPEPILEEIAQRCKKFHIYTIASDQHQPEALAQLLSQKGISLDRTPISGSLKVTMVSNIDQLLRQGRLRLLDFPEQTAQLLRLKKVKSDSGKVAIQSPKGERDDLAMVTLLAAHKATWYIPDEPKPEKVRTVYDDCMDQIKSQRVLT